MMRQYELVERVLSYNPKADEALLNRAYVYAMMAHTNQKRASGDPYFSHPLEVAAILTELRLDDATIATALLHDVIEDTPVTKANIDQYFGPEIGTLVDGLTKINKLDLISKKSEQAENFHKLLVAISTDIRVLLVKLADRLHNMRTLEHNKPESRQRNSEETLEIYAPLAGRMGMQGLREELEDLSFKWLHPQAYATVSHKLTEIRTRNVGLVEEIKSALKAKFAEAGIKADIAGREKKPYSIWRKMENKQISLEQLSDIYGFRIIVDKMEDCYRGLGVVHATWRAVPGRFKDYISTPKQNNYQSIHTTIIGPRKQRVELQIRTPEMHSVAEYGIAAHALYKDRIGADAGVAAPVIAPWTRDGHAAALPKDNPYLWLRHLVATLQDGNPEDFLENTKLELFHDQVFCFTPKGSIIALPRGATPIDFAYAVHTDVGNSCIGALVNGRQLPLTSQLRNGDEVQILTSKGQMPPAAWEQIAVTGRARSAVRRATRDALKKQYAELGRRLILSGAERWNLGYTDDRLKKALFRFTQKSVEEVHASVGRAELAVTDVLKAIFPDAALAAPNTTARQANRQARAQADDGWFNLTKVIGLKFRWPGNTTGTGAQPAATEGESATKAGPVIPIRGLRNDIPVKFEESGAVPGDRIVGVLSANEGIRIFQIHSPKLSEFEQDRWIDVTWDIDPDKPERFPAKIVVTVVNEPGTLGQIAQLIGEADGNIDNLRMTRRASDFTDMLIELEVWDLRHLNAIIAGLKAKPAVSKVERLFD
jgi:GTP pyrophosphokinase